MSPQASAPGGTIEGSDGLPQIARAVADYSTGVAWTLHRSSWEDAVPETVRLAGMRNALSRAGMEAQILYCQQAEALMVNALPVGLGMK